MTQVASALSEKSITVLEEIAEGRTYEQILARHTGLTYLDIFTAAREALMVSGSGKHLDFAARLQQIKQKHPRAYEKWTTEEDNELTTKARAGTDVLHLAWHFKRQPSAIRSRLAKLGLEVEAP